MSKKRVSLSLISGLLALIGTNVHAAQGAVPATSGSAPSAVTAYLKAISGDIKKNPLIFGLNLMGLYETYQQAQLQRDYPVVDTTTGEVIIQQNNLRVVYEFIKSLTISQLMETKAARSILYAPHHWILNNVLQKIFGVCYGSQAYHNASFIKRYPMFALVVASFFFNNWWMNDSVRTTLRTGCDKLVGVADNAKAMREYREKCKAGRILDGNQRIK